MYLLGIDIGSTTIKAALLLAEQDALKVVATAYERHNAAPAEVGRKMLQTMLSIVNSQKSKDCPSDSMHEDKKLIRLAITGSVGMGYALRMGVPFKQEVIAAAEVVKQMYPEVHTLVDIGGEDSKMIFFEPGRVPDMRMNGNCAGGTGAFIDQTATLLGVDVTEINGLAVRAEHVYPIASRCGVFSKTDIQNLISRSVSKEDIAASMLNAVSMQVVSALARGQEVLPQVLLCGGPFAYIPELCNYIRKAMGIEKASVIVPEHSQFIPAIGTALLTMQDSGIVYDAKQVIDLFDRQTMQVPQQNALPLLFSDEKKYNEWVETKVESQKSKVETQKSKDESQRQYFLGVDSGSTTTKVVLLDAEGDIVYKDYSYNNGNSYNAFLSALERLHRQMGDTVEIAGSCSTGYGENLLRTAFSLDYGIVETMAHFKAAQHMLPEVSFVLDIGGQDMKAIFVENGSIRRIEINEACSSGCGSFIMTFAKQLGYEVDEFARMATLAQHPYDLGTRCTVFMNSKVKQAMREGAQIDDIAAGFSYSVIKNCLYKVLKLQSFDELGDHIMVQGGTFRNHSVVRALELLTGKEVYVSQIPELMGAYGCALYAKERKQVCN